MHLIRLIRMFNAPLVCLVIASLVVGGCRYGTEEVSIPAPRDAFVTADGKLLLSIHIERELQPKRTGWHWVIIEPDAAAVLLGRSPRDPGDDTKYPVWVGWQGENKQARIEPPMLESGYAEPIAPERFGPLTRLDVAAGEDVFRIASGVNGAAYPTPSFTIQPSFVDYTSPGKRVVQGIGAVLAAPFVIVFASVFIVWLIWFLLTDDSGLSPI